MASLLNLRRWIILDSRCYSRCSRWRSTVVSGDALFMRPTNTIMVAKTGGTTIPHFNPLPEVMFMGKPNVGKELLMNTIANRTNLKYTGKKEWMRTRMYFYRVGENEGKDAKVVMVDTPSYASPNQDKQIWNGHIQYFIESRAVLQQVYILFECRSRLQPMDIQMLECLESEKRARSAGKPHFCRLSVHPVFTKVDKLRVGDTTRVLGALHKAVFEVAPSCEPPILTSSLHPVTGISEIRQRIAEVQDLNEDRGQGLCLPEDIALEREHPPHQDIAKEGREGAETARDLAEKKQESVSAAA